MKTKPNTLARLVEMMKCRFEFRLMANAASCEANEFPCGLCRGEGLLIKTVRFSPLRKSSQFFKKKNGQDIIGIETCECPACYGTGVNQEMLAEKIKGIA